MEKHDRKEIIFLAIMSITVFVTSQIIVHSDPDELKEFIQYVLPVTIGIFLVYFIVRRHMIKQKFRKYLEFTPVKSRRYKTKFVIKAVNSGVFFATELFSIGIVAMYVIIFGFGMMDNGFVKIQVWETIASLCVFPFVGQIMPLLMKRDEKNHKASQEKAGLYYETYY